MAANIFDGRGLKTKRKRNIIRTKYSKGKNIPILKDPNERYHNIFNYYKNEKKTNKFIDKRKNKNIYKSSKKLNKKKIFNLDNSLFNDKHLSIHNEVYSNSDLSDNSQGRNKMLEVSGKKKKKKKKNATNDLVQEKIEKRKLWKIKKYEIKEKLQQFDEHFEDIKHCVLSLNNDKTKEEKNVHLERRKNDTAHREKKEDNIEDICINGKRENRVKDKLVPPFCENIKKEISKNETEELKKEKKKVKTDRCKDISKSMVETVMEGIKQDGYSENLQTDKLVNTDKGEGIPGTSNKMYDAHVSVFEKGILSLEQKRKWEMLEDPSVEGSLWHDSDESNDELIEEIFSTDNYHSLSSTKIVSVKKDTVDEIVRNFLVGGNEELCSYFVNDVSEERINLPLYISIENKKYELKDVVRLLDRYPYSSQKKLLYRIYHINMFNRKKKRNSIYHASFFFSFVDFCILNIWKCLKFNLKLHDLIQNYKKVILDFSQGMKAELHLYVSFILLIVFSNIQTKVKTKEFYKKKREILQEYVHLNREKEDKQYDVHVYQRILDSIDLFSSIFERHESGGGVSSVHFAIVLFPLLVYPMDRNSEHSTNHIGSGDRKEMNEEASEGDHPLHFSKDNVGDEDLLSKFFYLKEGSTMEIDEESPPLISYIIELVEYLFYRYFHSKNANLVIDEGNVPLDDVLTFDTYANVSNMEGYIKNVQDCFAYSSFDLTHKLVNENEIKLPEEEKKIVSNLGVFYTKKDLKNAIILLNIYNIIVGNSKKYSQAFFYLSFKILNSLLFNIIRESNYDQADMEESKTTRESVKKKKKRFYELSFSVLTNLILFLKRYIESEINIYILTNHIIVPCLFYLYMNFLKFVIYFRVKINFALIIQKIEEVKKGEEYPAISKAHAVSSSKKETYFYLLLTMFKVVQYAKCFTIKPIICQGRDKNSIPLFTPKYANNRNPKDFLFMRNGQTKFAEMKSAKKKLKQQKKLDYNELRKENNYILGLKAREEQERVRRNRENYKKIKLMAKQDVEEYNRMKTYTN
ncbi:conserved Plasmodium protein, unknown function [Plasmodium ovale curtisi]|uniref:Uncharacterized protein n=1 Tax=Plasmodium ovale curtisi TaxID=864141 RepID=A0A1A8VWY3_PLAOA|nr:conserved Plasmodium protein, unknown function [Plasmodium ovale curtisi]